jgi:hypothetical protein
LMVKHHPDVGHLKKHSEHQHGDLDDSESESEDEEEVRVRTDLVRASSVHSFKAA